MSVPPVPPGRSLRLLLKRGFLVAAANWQLAVVQFVAESAFKLLLAVPVVAGVVLVVLLFGGTVTDLAGKSLRETVGAIAAVLVAQPFTLAAFTVAVGVVLLGGSALTFFVRGGTISTLAAGERQAGPLEPMPLRSGMLQQARQLSIDRFVAGARRLFPRYLVLGLLLLIVYASSFVAYLAVVLKGYPGLDGPGVAVVWTVLAALSSASLVVWIICVNFFYLLIQVVIAVDDCRVPAAFRQAASFVSRAWRDLLGVFLAMLLLVGLATVVSVLATTGLGLISFVPLAGLAVVPLQIAAWLIRGLVFQFLGLAAIGSYLSVYRPWRAAGGQPWDPPEQPVSHSR